MKLIEAVIFDMDGVIFDTEPLHARAWQRAMATCGVEQALNFFDDWIGIPDVDLGDHLDEKYPELDAPGAHLARKRALFTEILTEELVPFPGLSERLPLLKKRIKIGLATSSHREDMERMLNLTNLSHAFEATSCYEDVTHHKPHPAPYLLAAERLGVAPHHCVAVDDSPSGVKSAKAAGMLTFGITSSFTAEDLSIADQVFPTTVAALEEMLEFLEGAKKRMPK